MNADSRTVSEVGEAALLRAIAQRIEPRPGELWSGDDAAFVRIGDGDLLVTVDLLVEGLDFDRDYSTGADVGWKAMAVNASDIAAMGGRPQRAVCAVGLRNDTSMAFFDDLLEGLLEGAEALGAGLVGGDISGAEGISVAVTMLGTAARPVTRSGARAGDAIAVTGELGAAAAGLLSLRQGHGIAALETRQLRPEPRIEEGVALAAAGATAMIDVSDGLALDLSRLLEASGVGCNIYRELIPMEPEVYHLASHAEVQPIELALAGGEDFELVCTLPPEAFETAREAVSAAGTHLTKLGEVTEGARLVDGEGLDVWKERGWQHLRDR